MKIALALSGGGFRATVFHLGVIARLAEEDRLEEVTFLSTVSGGSLCVGLVLGLNGLVWPKSADYIQKVLPEARRLLTTVDVQAALIRRVVGSLGDIFGTRADDLSALMQKYWGITARLPDLPEKPRWIINATCYESGKNWRFERFRMGDYLFGYSYDVDLPITDAMAASAGFPGLIGPLELDTSQRAWFKYEARPERELTLDEPEQQKSYPTIPIQPAFSQVHLWDGGVYDNHGLEGVHDFRYGWREGIDFLIVSDGAGRSKPEAYRHGVPQLVRLASGIMMDQIRSLRARAILERLINHRDTDRGAFLQIGNTYQSVLEDAGLQAEIAQLTPVCLSEEQTNLAATMETVIRKLSQEEYERLFRHGFEVADYTLYAYNADLFHFKGFANSMSANKY
jgi:NTE family protein